MGQGDQVQGNTPDHIYHDDLPDDIDINDFLDKLYDLDNPDSYDDDLNPIDNDYTGTHHHHYPPKHHDISPTIVIHDHPTRGAFYDDPRGHNHNDPYYRPCIDNDCPFRQHDDYNPRDESDDNPDDADD